MGCFKARALTPALPQARFWIHASRKKIVQNNELSQTCQFDCKLKILPTILSQSRLGLFFGIGQHVDSRGEGDKTNLKTDVIRYRILQCF
jgi:hypothetical protein